MYKRKISVLIVEDSKLYQSFLKQIIESDPGMQVCGVASSGRETRKLLKEMTPDVVTLDLNLEDVTDFKLLEYILKNYPRIHVIVVSSMAKACEEAIKLGANDFIEKISNEVRVSPEHFGMLLQMKIKMLVSKGWNQNREASKKKREKTSYARTGTVKPGKEIILIGASVGGTESTLQVLRDLPENLPPILIVQHMPVGFTSPYAIRLDRACNIRVLESKDGMRLEQGMAVVAESGKHMKVVKDKGGLVLRSIQGDKVKGFCPSIDVLFRSAAEASASGIGIIMTGMGRDGVEGITKMHENGFYTLGQSEESCVVYGMSKAAYEADALDELLSPEEIRNRIIEKYKPR